MGFRFYKNN